MSGEDTFFMLFGMLIVSGPWAMVIVGVAFMRSRERAYMAEQRITGRDKQRMIDFLSGTGTTTGIRICATKSA